MVAGIEGLKVDGSEGAVLLEVGGAVDERVLAAELFLDVAEAGGDVLDLYGIEGRAAGGLGDDAEDLVAFVLAGGDVGGDGLDDGLGALAHLDGVGLLDAAVVVVTVGDDDEGAADGTVFLEGEHLVAAGLIESVVERGASAGTELADALIQQIDVVGEGLGDVGLDVKAFDEGAVVAMEDLEEELDGGVLLELEALADGGAGVEHNADTERKIRLLLKAKDGDGGMAVVEEAEVLALEAGDEMAFFVGNGEDEIDFVGLNFDGGDGLSVIGSFGVRSGWGQRCRRGLVWWGLRV